jgi:hypothetical protein
VRGRAGDPLLVVYGDFTCPRCAVAATPTLFTTGAATGHAGPRDAAFLAAVAS